MHVNLDNWYKPELDKKKLKELSTDFEVFTALRNEPLLSSIPENKKLIELLSKRIG